MNLASADDSTISTSNDIQAVDDRHETEETPALITALSLNVRWKV